MKNRLFYKLTIVLTFLLAVCTLPSCSDSKKKSSNQGLEINPLVEELDKTRDEALLVALNGISGDVVSVTVLETGEQKTYSYRDAKEQGNVKGSLTIGDTLSVFPDNANDKIAVSINVSELRGRWYYDIQQHRGFQFESGGALSSINTTDVSFREWKLLNGKLYLYYIDMQKVNHIRNEYLIDEAEIISLNKESLSLQFRGQVLNCRRQLSVLKFRI